MITVKTFVFNPFQVNTYVVSDESRACVVIDPACSNQQEFESLIAYIQTFQLTPTSVILTHGHVDHLLGLSYVTQYFNLIPIIHQEELAFAKTGSDQAMLFGLTYQPYTGDWKTVLEGDEISFGQTRFKIFLIPGHSPAGMALYSSPDKVVFTGDVLFKGSIGRTDLPGGDFTTLIANIRSKLLTLPPLTMIFPGHGPYSTIENEIKYNPFLI
ncbi:MAG: MBL fold metallo-hydrolase [Bacteroidales bacterium]|nr:MBL fold metallo-hydrolase [Bacteroidales bacterium]